MLPPLAGLFLPLQGLWEALTSDSGLGVTLILAGLLIGAYGKAGEMPVITLLGILAVIAGVLDQFSRAAGQVEGVSGRISTTLAFIGAVLLGIFLLGAGGRSRSPLAVIPVALGGLILLTCALSLLLAILGIDGPLGSFR